MTRKKSGGGLKPEVKDLDKDEAHLSQAVPGPIAPGPHFQHIYCLYASRPYRIVDRFVVLERWWTQMELSQQGSGLHLMKGPNLEKHVSARYYMRVELYGGSELGTT
jgi:hypothetical protein